MTPQPVFDGSPESAPAFLAPTYYVDSDAPVVKAYAEETTAGHTGDTDKAIALFEAVRDGFRYDPYSMPLDPEAYRASTVITQSSGYCVTKTIVLAAVLRASGIPAAVGFADVKNHLTTPKLREVMGSDLFIYHGYAALFLNGRWLKASSAFNTDMCERFGVKPLVFDGKSDALLHEFDQQNRRHMEYVNERGVYADPPMHEVIEELSRVYPKVAELNRASKLRQVVDSGFQPSGTP
jgi:transglutaminase-like putative cysteine protease